MVNTHRVRALVCAGCLLVSVQASAQSAQAPPQPRHPRFYLGADAGAQVTTTSADSTVTFKLYGEDARLTAKYRTAVAPVMGARAGLRVWRKLTLGLGATLYTNKSDADVSANLPHPFHFQRPRTVEGTAPSVLRDEAAVYLEVGWETRLTPRIDVTVFAGPAIFNATQDAATKVTYTEQYPYDAATYTAADMVSKSVSATGVTVGADVAYRLTRSLRASALLRYAHATADVSPVDGQPFSVTLGGLQVTAGIRFLF